MIARLLAWLGVRRPPAEPAGPWRRFRETGILTRALEPEELEASSPDGWHRARWIAGRVRGRER